MNGKGNRLKTQRLFYTSALLCSVLTLSMPWALAASDANLTTPIVALDEDPQLSPKLLEAYESKGDSYKPRTEHFIANGQPKYINRLILEKSPYLLQHAHNPVNWYPFGEEAFVRAQADNKPIFLSIGYSTCHWCHVMERESFENEAIAEQMNNDFISIKVDREQLPDVDSLYMSAVLLINGSGGWPMSNFTDSEGRPFHGATYIPPELFSRLLDQVDGIWTDNKSQLLDTASQVSKALNRAQSLGQQAQEIGEKVITRASSLLLRRHDDFEGGFSGAPKFPQESALLFLLNEARSRGDTTALNAVNFTLGRMAAGGIHDQIGGGFHRYAVDPAWLVPHFEKMLYNQGLLARAYSEAYVMGGDADHAATARDILDYVEREMMNEDGLFYSATDADSEGAEGTFFLWSPQTLREVLNEADAKFAEQLWGVTDSGNFEHKTILHRPADFVEFAEENGMSIDAFTERRKAITVKLRNARYERVPPLRDDKIITAWNAIMINAFAEVGFALQQPRYVDIAVRSATNLWEQVRTDEDTLWRTSFDGDVSVAAKQTDYAYLAEALVSVYDVTGDELWLERASAIVDQMVERFWDDEHGGFFLGESVVSGTALTVRPKDLHDSSIPSGNSVALRALAKLYKRTGEERFADQANKTIAAFSGQLVAQPGGYFYLLKSASEHLFGESGPHQYAARGVVHVSARKRGDNNAEVQIRMKPGWHINSNQPVQDYLIPTAVTSGDPKSVALNDVSFPDPVFVELGFERSKLSLFAETVSLLVSVDGDDINDSRLPLNVQIQACNDEVCLAPETVSIDVSWIN